MLNLRSVLWSSSEHLLENLLCINFYVYVILSLQICNNYKKKINSLIFFYTDSQTESLGEKMFQITDEIRCHFQDLHTTALHLRKVSAFERACLLKT